MHKTLLTDRRRRRAALPVILLLILIIAVGALPFSAAADTQEPAVVKVGYYENEVFEEGASPGAVKTGYAYEYYRKLSEYTGWKYEYIYGSFADLYEMLLRGEIDFLAGLAYKEERKGLIGYPDAAMGSETYNLVKHDSDEQVTADPATLSGKRIGVLNSAMVQALNSFLTEHDVTAEVVTFDDYETLFAAFDSRSVDILAAEGDGAYGRNHAEVLCPFGASDYYLCVNIKRPDLLGELNLAQERLAIDEPGYLDLLESRYYPVSMASRAFSEAEEEWLDTHTELRLGYLENYLPYSASDSNGKVTGVIKEYMPKLLERLDISGLKVKYQSYRSYDEMIADVGKGKIDVAYPVGGGLYYAEESGIYQSLPVTSSTSDLIYKGEFNDQTTSTFAVNKNNHMQEYYIRTHFPDASIVYYSSIDECLSAVVAGTASCTTLNGLRALSILKNNRYRDLSARQLRFSDDRCFGVKIGNDGLLRLLNRGVNVVGSEYAQNLAYRYTDDLYHHSFIDMIRENLGLFIVAVIFIAGLIIFFLSRDIIRRKKEVKSSIAARYRLEDKNRELAESQQALSDALAAAEHANSAKTTFLNNMSHDIRTPMNAIVGFTSMAAAHIDNKELVKDYLSKITVSSQHLLSLINDVLDMSRIESGKMTLDESEVHLPDMIHDLHSIIQPSVVAKQQDLFIDIQDVVNEDIVTDKLRLNQVLLNILTNAVKFTPSGGTISFRVIEKASQLKGYATFEFRIKDNGMGMSKEFQKTIFEAFSREKSSTVSGIQGTGLGMAIAKSIVDMMGGTITVDSTEGKGTEFIVVVPCKISSSPSVYTTLDELQGLRVLVADDDADTCLSVSSMLRDIGMRPDWTTHGKEAVIRAKEAFEQEDRFWAYIIDLMMPDINGIETVRRIRRVVGDDAPIIVLTAYDWKDIEKEAREAGVTAFCTKPLFLSELRDVLMQSFRVEKTEEEKPEEERDFTGKRVLLAEDNEMNQIIAQSILENVGLLVEVAPDGTDAVRMVEYAPAGYYDIILMDIQMPLMDGYTATERIRELDDPEKAKIPIIAVTANAFEEDRRNALKAGMDGYLAKPYDVPRMMEAIGEFL